MENEVEEEITVTSLPSHDVQSQPSSPTQLERAEEQYFPECSYEVKPEEGQQFHTWEEAYQFYNTYAAQAGFSTKIHGGKKKKETDVWKWRTFACSKEGKTNLYYDKKRKNPENADKRRRGDTRCHCKAKLNVIRNKDTGLYRVTLFTEYHNHPLSTPSKVHFLRSHRKVSHVAKSLLDDFDAANVPTSQQLRLMAKQAGGIQNMGCTEKDIRNYKRTKREKRKGHDAECLKEYFLSEREKNPSFFFKIEKDGSNNMTRCFWVDSVAREAYTLFGDVVVFDTTYNTNEYCMIFAPLTGVNHHGQTIVLASAFLSNESKESFTWLFEQWLEVFSIAPKVIITDQDPSMIEVIPCIFPNTVHRFCIWHIMNKFPEKIGLVSFKQYYEYFQNSIYNSETVEDFELSWKLALQKSDLEDHQWLKMMYSLRTNWVPAYLRDHFHAGMSSSQRAESNHSFFKKYVDKRNSLMLFISRFGMAVERQKDRELRADHIDIYESPKLITRMPIEEQMREVYTLKIFQLFQKQVDESEVYYPKVVSNNDTEMVYEVQRINRVTSKVRRLVYDMTSKIANCSCKSFEFEGIPCRHIIAFLKYSGIFYLPDVYVMRRWTKRVKRGTIEENTSLMLQEGDESIMMRKTMLSHLWSSTIDLALLSKEGTEYLKITLESSIAHIKSLNRQEINEIERLIDIEGSETINEPISVKAKGSGKRLKTSKEDAMVKPRQCKACKQRGGHDSRNCPLLNS